MVAKLNFIDFTIYLNIIFRSLHVPIRLIIFPPLSKTVQTLSFSLFLHFNLTITEMKREEVTFLSIIQ